jgi:hypothetical protein
MIDGYDPVGNRVSRLQDGVPIAWNYDNDYRLLGQQTAGAYATFAFDSLYNTTLKWHQGQAPQTMLTAFEKCTGWRPNSAPLWRLNYAPLPERRVS